MAKRYIYTLNSSLGELELNHNPIGWDDADITLERDSTWGGVFNNYSLGDLEFIQDAKDYLIQLWELEGVEMQCTITVKRYDYSVNGYNTVFEGVLNGITYMESQKNGGTVSIKIGESATTTQINSKQNVKINYNSNTDLYGNPIATGGKYYKTAIVGNNITTTSKAELEASKFDPNKQYNIISLVNTGNNENINSPTYIPVSDLNKVADGGFFYQTFNRKSNVRLEIDISIYVGSTHDVTFIVAKGEKTNPKLDSEGFPVEPDPDWLKNVAPIYELFRDGYDEHMNEWVIKKTVNVELNTNEVILIYIEYALQVGAYGYFRVRENSFINATFNENITRTNIAAIRVYDLANHIIKSIAPNAVFESDLLNTTYDSLMFFNGYLARGMNQKEANFSMSLSELFKTISILCNCGLSVAGDSIKILPLDEIYSQDIAATIDDTKNATWIREVDPKLYISDIECGYTKTEYGENSGLQEYNNKSEYSTANIYSKTKLSLLPSARGDGYGITFAAEKPINGNGTTDSKYDTDIFFLDTIRQSSTFTALPDYFIQRGVQGFTNVKGIPNITTPINLKFTPARLLVNNSEKITTGIYSDTSKVIKFNGSQNNTTLATQINRVELVENGDIEIWKLKAPRFSGFRIKFDWQLSIENFENAKTYKLGRMKIYDPVKKKYTFVYIDKLIVKETTREMSFEGREQYEGAQHAVDNVLATNEQEVFITDNGEKIRING